MAYHELTEKIMKDGHGWGNFECHDKVVRQYLSEKARELKEMHDRYEGHFDQDKKVLEILGLEPEKEKVWCEHMKNKGDGLKLYKWPDDSIPSLGQSHTEYFMFCPICGVLRPYTKA